MIVMSAVTIALKVKASGSSALIAAM